jgi:hypothetical protein
MPRLAPWFAARPASIVGRECAVRPRGARRECVQTFEGTDYDRRLLIVDGAGVGVAAYSEVLVRTSAVLVANVALAHIACHDEDFHGWVKETCLAPRHDVPLVKETSRSCSPQPASWFAKLARVRGWPDDSADWRTRAKADKPKGCDPTTAYRISTNAAGLSSEHAARQCWWRAVAVGAGPVSTRREGHAARRPRSHRRCALPREGAR